MSAVAYVILWTVACLGLALAGGVVAAGALPTLGRYAPAVGFPVAGGLLCLVALWGGLVSIPLGLALGVCAVLAGTALTAWRTEWRGRVRDGLPAYALFLGAFLFMLGLRALDPAVDPASGEKFLDFGLLRAHLRATTLPAEDIWFAGEPFSYYYAGQYLLALLARLTGVPARYAYNLGLATGYATLVTAAYGVAGAIGRRYRAGRTAALFGAFFVGFASNLQTAGRVLFWALPDPVVAVVAGATSKSVAWLALQPLDFHYWSASRITADMITEFPLFAYVNGDLHAHMLAQPFTLLGVTCLLTYFRAGPGARRYRQGLVFGGLPAVAGVVAATNAWSLAVLAGLTWLTLYFAPTAPLTLGLDRLWPAGLDAPDWVERGVAATTVSAVVVGLAVCWSLPVWSFVAGAGRSVALFPTRSSLWSLLVVHGAFLAILVPYLLVRLELPEGVDVPTAVGTASSAAIAVTGGLLVDAAGIVVFGLLVALAWVVLDRVRTASGQLPVGYETVLALGALGLVVLVELVYLQEPSPTAEGRFNTFFKIYAEVWILFGVAAAVVVGRVLGRAQSLDLPSVPDGWARPALAGLLVVSTGVYGVGVVGEWTTHEDTAIRPTDDPTLDALAFAHERYPDRMAAIGWLDNRSGTPTIVSAPGTNVDEGYRWINAPSSLTGLPTVVGWNHEVGYRGHDAYWDRVADVRDVFTGSAAERRRLLAKYDVEYVYYGPIEQSQYRARSFADERALTVAFENDAVTIYRVVENEPARQASTAS